MATIVEISSDSEIEECMFNTFEKDKRFQEVWRLATHVVSTKISFTNDSAFPYSRLKSLLMIIIGKISQFSDMDFKDFTFQRLLKLFHCFRLGFNRTSDDEKICFLLVDFMVLYTNFKCEQLRDIDHVDFAVNNLLSAFNIIFGGKLQFSLMVLLKLNSNKAYAYILYPLYKKHLSEMQFTNTDHIVYYIQLILCFRKWIKLVSAKNDKNEIYKIAEGIIKDEKRTKTVKSILPAKVPPADEINYSFTKISDLIGFATKKGNEGTSILLKNKSMDLKESIDKFFKQYENLINRDSITKLDEFTRKILLCGISHEKSFFTKAKQKHENLFRESVMKEQMDQLSSAIGKRISHEVASKDNCGMEISLQKTDVRSRNGCKGASSRRKLFQHHRQRINSRNSKRISNVCSLGVSCDASEIITLDSSSSSDEATMESLKISSDAVFDRQHSNYTQCIDSCKNPRIESKTEVEKSALALESSPNEKCTRAEKLSKSLNSIHSQSDKSPPSKILPYHAKTRIYVNNEYFSTVGDNTDRVYTKKDNSNINTRCNSESEVSHENSKKKSKSRSSNTLAPLSMFNNIRRTNQICSSKVESRISFNGLSKFTCFSTFDERFYSDRFSNSNREVRDFYAKTITPFQSFPSYNSKGYQIKLLDLCKFLPNLLASRINSVNAIVSLKQSSSTDICNYNENLPLELGRTALSRCFEGEYQQIVSWLNIENTMFPQIGSNIKILLSRRERLPQFSHANNEATLNAISTVAGKSENNLLSGKEERAIVNSSSLHVISKNITRLLLPWILSNFSALIDTNEIISKKIDKFMFKQVKYLIRNNLQCENQRSEYSHQQMLATLLTSLVNCDFRNEFLIKYNPAGRTSPYRLKDSRRGNSSLNSANTFNIHDANQICSMDDYNLAISTREFRKWRNKLFRHETSFYNKGSMNTYRNSNVLISGAQSQTCSDYLMMLHGANCQNEQYENKPKLTVCRFDPLLSHGVSVEDSFQFQKSSSYEQMDLIPLENMRLQCSLTLNCSKNKMGRKVNLGASLPKIGTWDVVNTQVLNRTQNKHSKTSANKHKGNVCSEYKSLNCIESNDTENWFDKKSKFVATKPCVVRLKNSKNSAVAGTKQGACSTARSDFGIRKKKNLVSKENDSNRQDACSSSSENVVEKILRNCLDNLKLERLEKEIDVLLTALKSLSKMPSVEAYFIINKIIVTFIYECLSSEECSRVTFSSRNYSFICTKAKQLQGENINDDYLHKIEYKYEELKKNTRKINSLNIIRHLDKLLNSLKMVKKKVFTDSWLQQNKHIIQRRIRMVPVEQDVFVKNEKHQKFNNESHVTSDKQSQNTSDNEVDGTQKMFTSCNQANFSNPTNNEELPLTISCSPSKFIEVDLPSPNFNETNTGVSDLILCDLDGDSTFVSTMEKYVFGSSSLDVMPDVFNSADDENFKIKLSNIDLYDIEPIIPTPKRNSGGYFDAPDISGSIVKDFNSIIQSNSCKEMLESDSNVEKFYQFESPLGATDIMSHLTENGMTNLFAVHIQDSEPKLNLEFNKSLAPVKPDFIMNSKIYDSSSNNDTVQLYKDEVEGRLSDERNLEDVDMSTETSEEQSGENIVSDIFDNSQNFDSDFMNSPSHCEAPDHIRQIDLSQSESSNSSTSSSQSGTKSEFFAKPVSFKCRELRNQDHVTRNSTEDLKSIPFWQKIKSTSNFLQIPANNTETSNVNKTNETDIFCGDIETKITFTECLPVIESTKNQILDEPLEIDEIANKNILSRKRAKGTDPVYRVKKRMKESAARTIPALHIIRSSGKSCIQTIHN